jgi:hypothetical protein
MTGREKEDPNSQGLPAACPLAVFERGVVVSWTRVSGIWRGFDRKPDKKLIKLTATP